LWPVSDRRTCWQPGINTARCNCAVRGSLSFDWSWRDGRRVLEPHPQHEAPGADCVCGLYSWRRPRPGWHHNRHLVAGGMVCGAVASWGQLQVHNTGFRAEHACVVTLAYPPGTGAEAVHRLEQVAAVYRVELVPLDRLEEAASRHGSPLPESLKADDEADQTPSPVGSLRTAAPRPDRQPATARTGSGHPPPLGSEPLPVRDRVGIGLILLSGLATACGSTMWFGRGTVAWVGLWMVAAGFAGAFVTAWCLEPHKALKHAGHRIRHHARSAASRPRRSQPPPAMTDAEFYAVEDALEPLYRHGNDLSSSLDPYRNM
jgi:hypothetical protein